MLYQKSLFTYLHEKSCNSTLTDVKITSLAKLIGLTLQTKHHLIGTNPLQVNANLLAALVSNHGRYDITEIGFFLSPSHIRENGSFSLYFLNFFNLKIIKIPLKITVNCFITVQRSGCRFRCSCILCMKTLNGV